MTTDHDPTLDPHLGRALRQAMNSYADSAPAPAFDAPAILRRTRRRRGLLATAASAAAVAVVATGAFLLQSPPSGPRTPLTPAAPVSPPVGSGTPSPSLGSGTPSPVSSPGYGEPSPGPTPSPDAARITVPDVVGLSQASAEQALAAAGLRVETHLFTDWKVPAGSVINTQPAAGALLPPDATVTVFVSKGRP
ncbi:PASTA domain-containing protein [Kitasatospora sp. NPDC088351]|uniref:PASTA domain-containing protein n=1 Tax=Kitasatospora sp. NPDC088351 TaxID=3155180 RepID=UPI003414AD43